MKDIASAKSWKERGNGRFAEHGNDSNTRTEQRGGIIGVVSSRSLMPVSARNRSGFSAVARTIFQQILFARRSCNRDCKSQMRQRGEGFFSAPFFSSPFSHSATFKPTTSPPAPAFPRNHSPSIHFSFQKHCCFLSLQFPHRHCLLLLPI